jgi:hypothetical protein
MPTRREFIRAALLTTCAASIGAVALVPQSKPELTKAEKDALIAAYLSTPQGREKLAAAMVQPIRTRLEYDKAGQPLPTYYSPTLDPDFLTLPTPESLAKPLKHYPMKIIK